MKTEDRLKEREVTIEYLEKAFDHYNHLCFGGLLPRPKLRLSQAKSKLGWIRYKVDANDESPIPTTSPSASQQPTVSIQNK